MKETVVIAQYLKIAKDIAGRIARGELTEGSRIYGRSVMASEYGVSPETIRRAVRLLSDMKVLETRPQSGIIVLSADNARRYIENFEGSTDSRSIKNKLKDLISERRELDQQILDLATELIQSRETFAAANEPFPNYEVKVPHGSAVIGKNIGALKFWQSTGGTIVAIRRAQRVILSPGPYAELYAGDVIILVGPPSAAEAANHMLQAKEVP